MQISLGCIHYTIKKYKKFGIFENAPKSGRPKITTERVHRSVVRSIIKNPFSSSVEIKASLPTKHQVSASTIRRLVINEGYRAYKAKRKPFLTKKHVKQRMEFFNLYSNCGDDFWKKVVFSDETRISLMASDKPPLVRRPRNSDSLDQKYLKPSFKHPISVMIWGCFSYQGLGEIYIIDGNLNNTKYIEILEGNLLPFLRRQNSTGTNYFQDDNAPAHRHKKVKEWMERNDIMNLMWPPQSPDLNPIENLWHFLKMKVAKHRPMNKKELVKAIKHVWNNEISSELIVNLIESMNRRLERLLISKGKHIDY